MLQMATLIRSGLCAEEKPREGDAMLGDGFAGAAGEGHECRGGKAVGPFAVIAQGPEAHDPGVVALVDRAFIADDDELFAEVELVPLQQAGEASAYVRGLKWDEGEFHEGFLS